MHIHILGICGTFMAGIAFIARSLGHNVTGSDQNVYPPMSTLLENEHISIIPGYDPAQLEPRPDLVIIGNAMPRGNPCVEYILNHNIPYISAPQWLHDNVLQERWVIAVSGTHGKTTTASMVNWILEKNNYNHGFIIGGVPGNFTVSSRLGTDPFFVIEADEYDCAFFDKRSKFMHYCPKTLIINNIEFDHADIFKNLDDIKTQFHHLIRLVPGVGKIIYPKQDNNISDVLTKGVWSEVAQTESESDWFATKIKKDASEFTVHYKGNAVATVKWDIIGEHNMHNALIAIAAAHHVGVSISDACSALSTFINTKRRLETIGCVNNITVYDDFAHHPTAIEVTIDALRSKIGEKQRILAVLEPRSNTMKSGISKNDIAPALHNADLSFLFQPKEIKWSVADIAKQTKNPSFYSDNIDELIAQIVDHTKENDHILIMSNGGFNGIHQKLLHALKQKFNT